MTTYSTEYLTDWHRLADLTTDLEAVRDGVLRDRSRQYDVFEAFAEDWALLIAERFIDADLIAACADAMEAAGCGLEAASAALEQLDAFDQIREVLGRGIRLPVSDGWALTLAGDRLLDADLAPRLDHAKADRDDVIAWHAGYASRSWEHFAEAAAWLTERDICLDDRDAPRYPKRALA